MYNIVNDAVEGKVFYPRSAGFSRAQVIDMITQRMDDGEIERRPFDETKLGDGIMHQFVTDWYELEQSASERGEVVFQLQEYLIVDLVDKIAK